MMIELGTHLLAQRTVSVHPHNVAVAHHMPGQKITMDLGGAMLVSMTAEEAQGLGEKLKLMAAVDGVNVPTLEAIKLKLAHSGYSHDVQNLREALSLLVSHLEAQQGQKAAQD